MADTKCFDGVADVFSLDYEGAALPEYMAKQSLLKVRCLLRKCRFGC